MTDNTAIDVTTVKVNINLALATDNENALTDNLYCAVTQMEIIDPNGDDNLTTAQQQRILRTVDQLLIRQND